MITINTEKGLINVNTWEEILERPAFRAGLNPADHELKSILGRYVFGDKVHCGLSNCRTPHARGYVVATKDGLETNIGKDCGSKYFGIDFDEQARQFEQDITAKENREILWNFFFRIDELEEKISSIRGGIKGADWTHKQCQALLNPARVPLVVARKLGDLAKQKSSLFTIPREATKAEFDRLVESAGRNLNWPQYIDEPVAEIRGIEALYQENNLRDLLVEGIGENLKSFKNQHIDDLSNEKLKFWKKWALSVETTLEKAEAATEIGRELLTKANLMPLLNLPGIELNEQKSLFELFITNLEG